LSSALVSAAGAASAFVSWATALLRGTWVKLNDKQAKPMANRVKVTMKAP